MNTSMNKTMLAVGTGTDWSILAKGDIAYRDWQNVVNAYKVHPYAYDSIMISMFQLGVIYGKKIERARRNGTAITPLDNGEK